MIGNFIRSIIEGIGSKKLAAALAWIIVTVGMHVLSTWPRLSGFMTADQINTFALYAAGVVVAYIWAQLHLDMATGGKTTTAFQVAARRAAEAAHPPHPAPSQAA